MIKFLEVSFAGLTVRYSEGQMALLYKLKRGHNQDFWYLCKYHKAPLKSAKGLAYATLGIALGAASGAWRWINPPPNELLYTELRYDNMDCLFTQRIARRLEANNIVCYAALMRLNEHDMRKIWDNDIFVERIKYAQKFLGRSGWS